MNTKSTTIENGKKLFRKLAFAAIALTAISVTGCKDDDEDPTPTGPTGTTIELTGDINTSALLTANNKYILKGFVYVKDGVTLAIEPGTIIKGDKATKGTLIVERGAQILAVGTAQKPIVFTSNQPAGSRSYGDWGGIIICGRAPINLPGGEGTVEGGTNALYGGTNPADNSGKLKYVRIEFCGIAFQPNQEINGLTMGGVGSGTEISHIQVSYSGDDSYEWFGGSANATNLVAFRGWDDDFDTDNGYSGKIQFAVALRDKDIADQSGSNGFESDNDGQGTLATPNTKTIFSNITVFGPMNDASTVINGQFKRAAHLRRSTQTCIYNSVMAGFPTGLFIDGSTTETNAAAGDLQFRNNIIAGCTTPLSASASFDIQAWFDTPGYGNSLLTNSSEIQCGYPLNLTSPSFLPSATSPLLSGADFSNANLSGMQSVNYRGAFGSSDWTQGWCNFDPQNTAY
ncbi:MAG TPA: T9SS C-terminal target domain-containing protein [Bacteroidia bacterium]|nr:T9SS C-terminal target domain-containing protein [Bacteroidia bacterium]